MRQPVAMRLSASGSGLRRSCMALLLVLGVSLPACDTTQQDRPRRGGTLVIAGPNDLGPLNPLVAVETLSSDILRFLLFLPLVRLDEALEYEGALAATWRFDGDTLVTFALRDDVRWHDGTPTTAHDVAFTFERLRDAGTGFANPAYFEGWHAVEVLDSVTVRFRLRPHADPLYGWTETPVVPRHLLADAAPAQLRTAPFNRAPVGNGPYRFVSHAAGDRTILEANPDFPEALGGPPNIQRVVWRVIPENSAQVAELLSGTVDMVLSPRPEQARELDRRPALRLVVQPSRNYYFIGWNSRRDGLGDPRVRRALTMAIDRQRLIDGLRAGFGELATGPVAPYHWAHDPGIRPLPHDPAGARELLAEAGWADRGDGVLRDVRGTALSFTLKVPAGSEFNRDAAELIRQDLAGIGVRLRTEATEWAVLLADVTGPERRFDAVLLGLTADMRLNLRDSFHTSALGGPMQLASYSNPEVDGIIDEAALLPDRDAARPLLHRLQRIMLEEQPWTFLYYYPDLRVLNARVRGAEMDIRGNFATLPRWWIEDDPAAASGT
jgi:peptide/nickel transport system substrate-binding protein